MIRNYLRLLFFLLLPFASSAVTKMSHRIRIDPTLTDTLLWTKTWTYRKGVYRDSDGTFCKIDGTQIRKKDTSKHDQISAVCRTNIDGGYALNCCIARKTGEEILLIFSERPGIHKSELNVLIVGDSFAVLPEIFHFGDTSVHSKIKITKAKLTVDHSDCSLGPPLIGNIDVVFTETETRPGKAPVKHRYYLMGTFCANVVPSYY